MPGPWNSANPPVRPGLGVNFVAAAIAAVETGVEGTALILGQSSWGPTDRPYLFTDQATVETVFDDATSTLRDGILEAFDGMDDGGATQVLGMRVLKSDAAAATVTLNDGSAAAALIFTAKYKGIRPNNAWSLLVQTNGSNKDYILYESGIELERFTNYSAVNSVVAPLLNAASKYMTVATTGTAGRSVANIVGVAGGTGGFAAGSDGGTLTLSEYAASLAICSGYDFDCVAISGLSDPTIQPTTVTWLRDYNKSGKRSFMVQGGPAAETQTTAAGRATTYDDFASSPPFSTYETVARELVILTNDVMRVSDGLTQTSARFACRVAGYIASIGIKRSPVNAKLTGWQVTNPYTPAAYELAQGQGIMPLSNDGVGSLRIDAGNTAMISFTTGDGSARPSKHQKLVNVATDHIVEETLNTLLKDPFIGQLRNTVTGRQQIVSVVGEYLRTLEKVGVLQVGLSTVDMDGKFVSTGNAVFLAIGYAYVETIERIFLTVRVR